MSKGIRGFIAPWIGGAARPKQNKGYRGFQNFWMGGGAKPPATVAPCGPRGMLHFWMGGSCVPFVIPVPPQPVPINIGGIPEKPRHEFRIRPDIRRDDDEIMAVIVAFLHMVNNQ